MERLARQGDVLLGVENYTGPVILVRLYISNQIPAAVLGKAK